MRFDSMFNFNAAFLFNSFSYYYGYGYFALEAPCCIEEKPAL